MFEQLLETLDEDELVDYHRQQKLRLKRARRSRSWAEGRDEEKAERLNHEIADTIRRVHRIEKEMSRRAT